jgi:hypothetical protein
MVDGLHQTCTSWDMLEASDSMEFTSQALLAFSKQMTSDSARIFVIIVTVIVTIDLSFPLFTGHYEKLPYDAKSMRSIYHIREYCVHKLSLVSYALGCLNT